MDRRRFVKDIFAASVMIPFLFDPKKGSDETGGELYLISDEPQRQMGLLLQALGAQGLIRGSSYFLKSPHPQAGELGRVLAGWRVSSSGGAAGISFRQLDAASRPSFTMVQCGRIVDPRRLGLSALWNEMQSAEAATGLTVVSFGDPASEIRPGALAAISLDGKRIGRFSLDFERSLRYSVRGGHVIVAIGRGGARVKNSPCRHQVCVSSSPVLYPGERIICAPNRFLVEIEGKGFVDSVTG